MIANTRHLYPTLLSPTCGPSATLTLSRKKNGFLPYLLCLILLFGIGLQRSVSANELININTATAEQLADSLPSIGPSKAKAIVDYRSSNGPFKTIEALTNVKGIGPRTLEKIGPLLSIDAQPSSAQSHAHSNSQTNTVFSEQTPSDSYATRIDASTTQAVRAVISKAQKQ